MEMTGTCLPRRPDIGASKPGAGGAGLTAYLVIPVWARALHPMKAPIQSHLACR
jgi:hypothetical protein